MPPSLQVLPRAWCKGAVTAPGLLRRAWLRQRKRPVSGGLCTTQAGARELVVEKEELETTALLAKLAQLRSKTRRLAESWGRVRREFSKVESATRHSLEADAALQAERQSKATAAAVSPLPQSTASRVSDEAVSSSALAVAGVLASFIMGLLVGLGSQAPVVKPPSGARDAQVVKERPAARARVAAPAAPAPAAPVVVQAPAEEGPLARAVAVLGRDMVSVASTLREVARSALQVVAISLGFVAVLLPLIGQIFQGIAFVFTPILQGLLKTLGALLHWIAGNSSVAGDGSNGAVQAQRALDGLGNTLEVIAGSAPKVTSALEYTAGKALPVVQATIVATSEVAADVSNF